MEGAAPAAAASCSPAASGIPLRRSAAPASSAPACQASSSEGRRPHAGRQGRASPPPPRRPPQPPASCAAPASGLRAAPILVEALVVVKSWLRHCLLLCIWFRFGLQKGQLLEKPLQMGQPLKKGRPLDIEAELQIASEVKAKLMKEHSGSDSSQKLEKVAMKELGFKRAKYFGWPNACAFTKAMGEMLLGAMRGDLPVVIVRPGIITSTFQDPFPGWIEGIRTMDIIIAAIYEQRLPCFIGGPILDLIPGERVVNAMMVAMATHYNDVGTHVVYHVTSALQNPMSCNLLVESTYAYCLMNPRARDDKKTTKHKRPLLFSRYVYFYTYMVLAYKTRLQVLYVANCLLLCGRLTEYHSKLNRSLNYLMSVAKFYAPYIFFKGCIDNTNLRRL